MSSVRTPTGGCAGIRCCLPGHAHVPHPAAVQPRGLAGAATGPNPLSLLRSRGPRLASHPAASRCLRPPAGLLVVGGVIAVIAVVTIGQGLNPAETLNQVCCCTLCFWPLGMLCVLGLGLYAWCLLTS